MLHYWPFILCTLKWFAFHEVHLLGWTCRLVSLNLYITHFGLAHPFGGSINSIRQLVVPADLGMDLGELSFGGEILQDDLGEALVLALPGLQPLISLFGYGDRIGGHRSMYVYLIVYPFFPLHVKRFE